MLTEFGIFLRKIRIENNEVTRNMANKLGVSTSYLSSVEIGKHPVPKGWAEKIINLYDLDKRRINLLRESIVKDTMKVTIDVSGVSELKFKTAILFEREFKNIDEDTIKKIHDMLFRENEYLFS